MKKRLTWAAAGLGYALLYGFWTAFITGGGHGNFIWFLLFIFVEFLGLYFPLMAALGADLDTRGKRIVFGSLILFNLISSSILLLGWITDYGPNGRSDFAKVIRINGYGFVMFCIGAHFAPTLFFLVRIIRAVLTGSESDEDRVLGLKLV